MLSFKDASWDINLVETKRTVNKQARQTVSKNHNKKFGVKTLYLENIFHFHTVIFLHLILLKQDFFKKTIVS